jgi:chorismate-pyruvate lyase
MTVTLESFLETAVSVSVLAVNRQGSIYSRNSLLHRQTDGMPVQFGIIRLQLHLLEPHIRAPIEEERIPLGRILIQHEILREVELSQLYRIACGPALAGHLGVAAGATTYGRTAFIHCHTEPALELLEIVTPAVEDLGQNGENPD